LAQEAAANKELSDGGVRSESVIIHTMNHLRISRGTFRYFEPLVRQQCIHTPRVISRSQQPWQSCRALSLPPKHNVIPLRRPYSQLTDSKQEPTTEQTSESEDRWANTPAYEMTFTCKQCNTRSSHKVSKQGYHHGTVLITCPGCKNKHLISDHMKVRLMLRQSPCLAY
jgi:hypothetical protein